MHTSDTVDNYLIIKTVLEHAPDDINLFAIRETNKLSRFSSFSDTNIDSAFIETANKVLVPNETASHVKIAQGFVTIFILNLVYNSRYKTTLSYDAFLTVAKEGYLNEQVESD